MSDAAEILHPRPGTAPSWVLVPWDDRAAASGDQDRFGGWRLLGERENLPGTLTATAEGWTLRTGPFGHQSAWYAAHADGSLRAIGGDALAVARAIGAGIDPWALVDDLLLGFRPDGRSAFEGVLPCGSAQTMEYSPAGARVLPHEGGADLEALGRRVAEAMDAGACVELTGGVDSRLLVALGLSAGGRPSKAFTIGHDDDPDVVVAKQMAEQLGIEHRKLSAELDAANLVEDTRSFVARSGFVCNAAAYGWLPGVFAQLADWRTAQLSGVGGEIGEGFYYSGFDGLFERLNSPRLWLKARVVVDGGRWASCFEPGTFEHRLRQIAAERAELNTSEPWRVRTDGFYTHARIHGWAIPVIRASAAWYRPITPFLSGEYHAWARSLTDEQMHNRAAQRELLCRLSPQLAAIPYAKQLAGPGAGKLACKLAKARRLAGRVLARPTVQPEQWVQTASELMESLGGADSVVDRMRSAPMVRVDRVAAVLRSDTSTGAHAIGSLVSVAMSMEALSDGETRR